MATGKYNISTNCGLSYVSGVPTLVQPILLWWVLSPRRLRPRRRRTCCWPRPFWPVCAPLRLGFQAETVTNISHASSQIGLITRNRAKSFSDCWRNGSGRNWSSLWNREDKSYCFWLLHLGQSVVMAANCHGIILVWPLTLRPTTMESARGLEALKEEPDTEGDMMSHIENTISYKSN